MDICSEKNPALHPFVCTKYIIPAHEVSECTNATTEATTFWVEGQLVMLLVGGQHVDNKVLQYSLPRTAFQTAFSPLYNNCSIRMEVRHTYTHEEQRHQCEMYFMIVNPDARRRWAAERAATSPSFVETAAVLSWLGGISASAADVRRSTRSSRRMPRRPPCARMDVNRIEVTGKNEREG